jgi:hypothetical protein
MFTDQVSELAHLNARGVTFAIVSRAPQDQIAASSSGWAGRCPGTRSSARNSRRRWGPTVLRAGRLPARRRPRLSHLRHHGARGRGAGQRLDLPRPHAPGPPGGVGGHPARPPAVAAVPVVAPARQLRVAPTRPRGSR